MFDHRHPFFELRLNGRSLQLTSLKYLLSVELKESQSDLDALTVQLAVPERAGEVLALAEPGSTFEVILGYGNVPIRSVFGDIIEISHSRSTSAPWVMSLQGVDCLHRLKDKQCATPWTGTHSQIVANIAAEVGLPAEVQDVPTTGGIAVQMEEDYATFLSRLAKVNNYFIRIEKASPLDSQPTLRFGRRSLFSANKPLTLTWGREIEKVDLKYSLEGMVSEVAVQGRNYAKDEDFSGKVGTSALRRISGGDTGPEMAARAFGATSFTVDNSPEAEQNDASSRATAELQERAEKFLTGSIDCIGLPEARSGAELIILGAAWPFSGKFLIEETTHSFDPGSGYHTSISFYSDSLPPRVGL